MENAEHSWVEQLQRWAEELEACIKDGLCSMCTPEVDAARQISAANACAAQAELDAATRASVASAHAQLAEHQTYATVQAATNLMHQYNIEDHGD